MSGFWKVRRGSTGVMKSLTADLAQMRRPRNRKPQKDSCPATDKESSVSNDYDGSVRNDKYSCGEEEQRRRLLKMKELPSTSCFSSNHILVNRERIHRGIRPVVRCRHLDASAKKHADEMAASQDLKKPLETATMVENVQRGPSIKIIHQMIMVGVSERERDNILSKRFAKFGMGAATGDDGVIYISQIFQEDTTQNRRPTL